MSVAAACLALVAAQSSATVDAVYIGHSLISDIPDMVMAISGGKFKFREQFIPGAPLRWQWEEPTRKGEHEPQFRGVYDKLIGANTDVLVMIDSVPRGDEASLKESIDYAGRYLSFARKKNPSVRVFYYEPWHDIHSGTPQRSKYDTSSPTRDMRWRPRLTADRSKWERVVAEVNQKHAGKVPMKLIPGGTGLGLLTDAIKAKQVHGLSSEKDLFSDDIHLNPLGKYFIACLHHRAIFGGKVAGKPYDIKNRWGSEFWDKPDWTGATYKKPSAATVRAIQEVADKVPL